MKKIGCEFPGKTGYCKRIEAAFVQCHEDGIKVLYMSFTLEEIKYWGNISNFMFIINKIRNKYADDIVFYPEILYTAVFDAAIYYLWNYEWQI